MAHTNIPDDIRLSLLEALQDIGESAFAASGRLKNFSDPGLEVDSNGRIPLPLQDVDAQRIIAASKLASLGNGLGTIDNTTIRGTWELNRNQFTLAREADFGSYIANLARSACVKLGIFEDACNINVEPDKLLLYEEGALLKPHNDAENSPGKFGTLMICLPSDHKGGELLLSHGGMKHRFSSANQQPSYAVWYSDVASELKEITAGYRLVLIYNLTQYGSGPTYSASQAGQLTSSLRPPLEQWLSEEASTASNESNCELIFKLDHHYADTNLRINDLKAVDRSRANALLQLAQELNFDVYLASVEKKIVGLSEHDVEYEGDISDEEDYDDYDDDDEDYDERKERLERERRAMHSGEYHDIVKELKTEFEFPRVVDLEGNLLVTKLKATESRFVQQLEDLYDADRVPDDHEFSIGTRSDSSKATHYYNDSAAVIVPRQASMRFLTKSMPQTDKSELAKQFHVLLQACMSRFRTQPTNAQAKSQLADICDGILRECRKPAEGWRYSYWLLYSTDPMFGKVVESLANLGRLNNLADAVGCMRDPLPLAAFQAVCRVFDASNKDLVLPALDIAINGHKSFSDAFEILKTLSQSVAGRDNEFADWIQRCFVDLLGKTGPNPSSEESKSVMEMSLIIGKESFVYTDVLPMVRGFAGRTRFILAFLTDWHKSATSSFSEEVTVKLFQELFPQFVANLDFDPSQIRPIQFRPHPGTWQGEPPETVLNLQTLFAIALTQPELAISASELALAIQNRAERSDPRAYRNVYIPLLTHTLPVALIHAKNTANPWIGSFYQDLLQSFVRQYVQVQPSNRPNWTRERVRCDCNDCRTLNHFLVDGNQQRGRFTMVEQRRKHLSSQLAYADYRQDTERDGRPQTLLVTKQDRRKADHNEWMMRCGDARRDLTTLKERGVEALLPEPGLLDQLISLRDVTTDPMRLPQTPSARAPLIGMSANWAPAPQLGGTDPPTAMGPSMASENWYPRPSTSQFGGNRSATDAELPAGGSSEKRRIAVDDLCNDSD